MRAAPDDSFMFEHGQCVIAVPVWAMHLDLAIVEPHGVGDDGRRSEDAALVHLLDRAPAELAQALLDLPDRLR